MIDGTDFFCGGGGSTQGLETIGGLRMRYAVNHWRRAVDTHEANHAHIEHDCADISQMDPRRYQRTAMAWFSPDCTDHTKATGKKRNTSMHTSDGKTLPSDPAERSRATMWDVVRFSEYHHYDAVIVENVIEATDWGRFPAWVMAMESLDYERQMVWMSSAHVSAGGPAAATMRNRWYSVWTRKGAPKPDIAKWTNPHGTCTQCGLSGQLVKWWKKGSDAAGGVFGPQYLWRCPGCSAVVVPPLVGSGTVINWNDQGRTLFDRRPALAERTLWKIADGLSKHAVNGMAMPFIVELRGGGSLSRAITAPFSTITAKGNHHGLAVPPGWDPLTQTGSVPVSQVSMADIRYRMVTAQERKIASAFPADYVLLGPEKDKVRMIGNAVTPNAARALGAAVVEALVGTVNLVPTPALELAA